MSDEQLPVTQRPIPGGWTEEEVEIDGVTLDVVRPAQPDAFLDQLDDAAHEAGQDPYWADLWPASREMAAFVLRKKWQAGPRTLELGCGIGLVGLAGLMSGLKVTFSDLHQLAVETAVENARRNGFPNADCVVLDWRQPADVRFPLILAADVLYEKELHSPLLDCLDAMLARDGTCWLGDPGRSAALAFHAAARDRAYFVRIADLDGNELREPTRNEFQLFRLSRG